MIAAVFTRYVPADAAPILDAGCGGGIQAEPLAELGFSPMTGIDLSDGMLEVARSKGLYAELKQQVMGERLDFEDDQFAAIICSGVFMPGHAPPHSFQELVRIARPGARIVFSLRSDAGQKPEYLAAVDSLTEAGAWLHVFSSKPFYSMPYGEPDVLHQIHVYEVL
jgi:SAM-dependent methyltransferase